jgi:hypothetical protein
MIHFVRVFVERCATDSLLALFSHFVSAEKLRKPSFLQWIPPSENVRGVFRTQGEMLNSYASVKFFIRARNEKHQIPWEYRV